MHKLSNNMPFSRTKLCEMEIPPPGVLLTIFMVLLTAFHAWPVLLSGSTKDLGSGFWIIIGYDTICLFAVFEMFVRRGDTCLQNYEEDLKRAKKEEVEAEHKRGA
eukprot:Colp12_sorted_trinity150504_noHs@11794